jgi:hypothetical protein
MIRSLITAALAAHAVPAFAAPFTIVESGRGYASLADAVSAVGDGDATIRIAPGSYRDCAVQTAGRVAYVAARAGAVIFDGGVCEGKATLVLRGRGAEVSGIIFQNTRVPDGNGAGIRLERGPLSVLDSIFRNAEEGILAGDDRAATVRIERSSFAGLGRCDRGLSCAHSIYIGHYGALIVKASRFERGTGGHYVKSRAARIEVTDTSFDDSAGRATNYMIDLSEGATGTIARNIFVGGRDKENYGAMITVSPEARTNRTTGLAIADNVASLAPGAGYATLFVANWSHEPLAMGVNRLGPGITRFGTR